MNRRRERYVDCRSQVQRDLREIDQIILSAEDAEDALVRAYLYHFSVVRLSGFLEKSVEAILRGYLEHHTSHRVLKFAGRQLSRLPNMTPEKMEQLVGSFDDDWRNEFSEFLGRDERRQTLGNLIAARHNLAHGGASKVSGTLLHEYYAISQDTVSFLLERFHPRP